MRYLCHRKMPLRLLSLCYDRYCQLGQNLFDNHFSNSVNDFKHVAAYNFSCISKVYGIAVTVPFTCLCRSCFNIISESQNDISSLGMQLRVMSIFFNHVVFTLVFSLMPFCSILDLYRSAMSANMQTSLFAIALRIQCFYFYPQFFIYKGY